MSRIRLEILNQILHFCDNSKRVPHGQEGYDPLYKVRDLLKETESLYAKAYCPSKELSLDKSMINFKGRIFFKQFNPSKPTRWGIKQFALCEAKTGYALKFLTYAGATTLSTPDTHLTATENIVQEMMADYAGHGHVLYTDSFYTSPNIVRALKAKQIGYCGTVQAGRKGMPEILHPNHLQLRKGAEPAFAKCKNSSIFACTWHDLKRVYFLSSVHGVEQVSKQVRSKKHEGGFRRIQKPLLAEDYNQYMGGVDTMNQLLGTYCFLHKQTKWYQTVFHRVREVALTNTYIVYSKSVDKPVSPQCFREQVIIGLLDGFLPGVARAPQNATPKPVRLTERHFLGTAKGQPDCTVCSSRIKECWKRIQTKWLCKQCNLPMCAEICFEIFHTRKDTQRAIWQINS